MNSKDNAYLTNSRVFIGLPNYRYVMSLLNASLQLAKREKKVLLVLYFSLQGQEQVNNDYGNVIGDDALTVVAERLGDVAHKNHYSLYLGKNKYLVCIMKEKENLSEAGKFIEKLTLLVSKPIFIDEHTLNLGVSLGVAAYPMHGDKAGVLLDIAEMKKRTI